MNYNLSIRPGVSVEDRHFLEDEISALGIEVYGGGSMVDGSESDITIESNKPIQEVSSSLKEFLLTMKYSIFLKYTLSSDDGVLFSIDGNVADE